MPLAEKTIEVSVLEIGKNAIGPSLVKICVAVSFLKLSCLIIVTCPKLL